MAEQTVIRVDKQDGARSTMARRQALNNLAGSYLGPVAPILDAATEANPAETPFALYWPVTTAAERTAGEAIAAAVASFHFGRSTQAELAKAIDDALRVYR